jgi:hypothetical protein
MWKGSTKTKKITPTEADGHMLYRSGKPRRKSEVRELPVEVCDC